MTLPEVVSEAEWRAARQELLVKEKEATRALDALAAERRWLPIVRIEKDYELLRDGDGVYRSYVTSSRGVDRLRVDFNLLDLTPYGRQEEWEDSPEDWPQTPAYTWWRKHDEHEAVAR
jgi:predicted dithiol-disulfide oxidoreductase (DUF899 family)